MTHREKAAWISLAAHLGVYGYYFATVLAAGPGQPYGSRLLGAIVLLLVVVVGCNVALAALRPAEAQAPADERERLIELKATSGAFSVVMVGTFLGAVAVALSLPAFYVANGLLAAMVLAEVVRLSLQVVRYRVGA